MAVSALANLEAQPGWDLVKKILNANIEVLTELILNGKNLQGEDATKEESDRLRDRLKVYKEVVNITITTTKKITAPEGEEPDFDPFLTVDQLKEKRKEVSG